MKGDDIMSNNNAIQSPYDVRDYTIKPHIEFPKEFSLKIQVPVKNQWSKPTCVAHALSSTIEYHHKKQYGSYRKFSTEFIYGLRDSSNYLGEGMVVREALKTIQKYGDVYYTDCPGNHTVQDAMSIVNTKIDELKELAYPHRITAYFKINSPEELKTALMEYGPVIVVMNTYDNDKVINDVYTYNPDNPRGSHCVFIYGWNENGWLVQNSWGKLYAWDGRFTIPFDFKFSEMWGIVDDIVENDIIRPNRNKVLDIVYKIINTIINLLNK